MASEAQEAIPCPLDEVVWSHAVVADNGGGEEIVLAAVKRDFVENFCGTLEAAGFSATRIVPSGLLLDRAFRHNYPEMRENALLVHIGARTTHLAFLEADRHFVRTVRLGGGNVTRTVTESLGIEPAPAEALKLRVLSAEGGDTASLSERTAVRLAAEQFSHQLHAEIVRSILLARRRNPAGQPMAIYLTGGGSLLPELAPILTEKLKLPTERFDPLRRVELSFVIDPESAGAAAPFLVDLVGLALLKQKPESSGLNLLPPSLVAQRTFRRRRLVLAAAAFMATTAFIPVADTYRRRDEVMTEKTAALERQLEPLRIQAARNAEKLALIAARQEQIAALQKLGEAKSSWIEFLTDLQQRLAKVEDVWLEKLRLIPVVPGARSVPLELAVGGCLLDRANPLSLAGVDTFARVKNLQELLARSPYISGVKNERFDRTQPGLLRFDFILMLNPERQL